MPEYIEREALISRLNKVCVTDDVFGMGMQTGIEHAINCTKEAPTADVVEVVRCKDCRFSRPVIGTAYLKSCKKFDCEMWHEGFCYYGERIGD